MFLLNKKCASHFCRETTNDNENFLHTIYKKKRCLKCKPCSSINQPGACIPEFREGNRGFTNPGEDGDKPKPEISIQTSICINFKFPTSLKNDLEKLRKWKI